MVDATERKIPELKTYSMENLGQLLKVSPSLSPEVFPWSVEMSVNSRFFTSLYEGVYKGRGVTIRGSPESSGSIRPRGVFIEHTAALGVNDLGEVSVSTEIFEGNMARSLTNYSSQEYAKYLYFLKTLQLPPGHRIFGEVHSHPVLDVLNNLAFAITNSPKVGNLPLTWSDGDFRGFLESARQDYDEFSTNLLITQTQISLMIATKETCQKLKDLGGQRHNIPRSIIQLPPYGLFKDLGIILYGGNHLLTNGKIKLERIF